MIPNPTHEEQMAAFERYAQAVRKVEKSLDFQDAIAAKDAWIGFLNVWLPDEKKMPEKKVTRGNVVSMASGRALTNG